MSKQDTLVCCPACGTEWLTGEPDKIKDAKDCPICRNKGGDILAKARRDGWCQRMKKQYGNCLLQVDSSWFTVEVDMEEEWCDEKGDGHFVSIDLVSPCHPPITFAVLEMPQVSRLGGDPASVEANLDMFVEIISQLLVYSGDPGDIEELYSNDVWVCLDAGILVFEVLGGFFSAEMHLISDLDDPSDLIQQRAFWGAKGAAVSQVTKDAIWENFEAVQAAIEKQVKKVRT